VTGLFQPISSLSFRYFIAGGSELRDIKYEFVAEPTNAAQMVGEFPKLFAYATEANFAGIQG